MELVFMDSGSTADTGADMFGGLGMAGNLTDSTQFTIVEKGFLVPGL